MAAASKMGVYRCRASKGDGHFHVGHPNRKR